VLAARARSGVAAAGAPSSQSWGSWPIAAKGDSGGGVGSRAKLTGAFQLIAACTALLAVVIPSSPSSTGMTGGDGQHGGEVPTGGGAPRGEPVGVDPKVRRVVAQSAHGGLHVVQLGGEDRFLAVPVLRCGHGNPGRDEPAAESAVLV